MKNKSFLSFLLALLSLLFSFYLMFHTFSYDNNTHEMRIASKAWSDFGAHIPLIRSFSYGPNLNRLLHGDPIESPLFPHEPIRYHFGFYAVVGLLEKLGMRIDWALNIPSALGLFGLLLLIYKMSYSLFQNRWVSLLSIIFFLFNGSLSFLTFFKSQTVKDIFMNSRFPSFGPWDGGVITAFWNLNIYTNQRHLALSYAIALAVLLIRNKPIVTAMLMSVLLFTNYATFSIAAIFLLWKRSILPLLLTLPALLLLLRFAAPASGITWEPGYLSRGNFLPFWWQNIGLHMFFIPLGIFLSPKHIRKMLLAPLTLLFILPNLFRFSPDMINNHKFFNFFLILGNMFSAYAIIRIGQPRLNRGQFRQIRHIRPMCQIVFIALLTLSGIIDFFPIINDTKGGVTDIPANPEAQFFLTHSASTDSIANSTWFYHPASIAGRALLSGYTYFTWSYGYDQSNRESKLKAIYASENTSILCRQLWSENVSFVELTAHPESYLSPHWELWNTLSPIYENPKSGMKIYSRNAICAE